MMWLFVVVCLISALIDPSVEAGSVKQTRWGPTGFPNFPWIRNIEFPRKPGSLRPMTDREVLFGHAPGPCTTLMEDDSPDGVKVLSNGIAIMTTGFFSRDMGRVWYLNMSCPDKGLYEFGIKGDFDQKSFNPFGLATWYDDKSGRSYVIISNHHPSGNDRIDMFEMFPTVLKYKSSVPVPFGFVKGLVMVDKDKFYMIQMSSSTEQRVFNFESSTGKGSGAILFYDGYRTHVIYTGLIVVSGISASRDGRYLYLAEYGASSIHVFKRDPHNNLNLELIQTVCIGSGPDMIRVCPETGDLWVTSHPNHRQLQNHLLGSKIRPPSQVLRVQMNKSGSRIADITEVYVDKGKEIAAATVADAYKQNLLIGSFGNQLIMCRLDCAGH